MGGLQKETVCRMNKSDIQIDFCHVGGAVWSHRRTVAASYFPIPIPDYESGYGQNLHNIDHRLAVHEAAAENGMCSTGDEAGKSRR